MDANTKFSDIYPQRFSAEQVTVTCSVQKNLGVNIDEFFSYKNTALGSKFFGPFCNDKVK